MYKAQTVNKQLSLAPINHLFDESIVIHCSLARERAQEGSWWRVDNLQNVILALAFQ